MKRFFALVLSLLFLLLSLAACAPKNEDLFISGSAPQEAGGQSEEQTKAPENGVLAPGIEENGVYTTKEDVALYLHLYGRLPDNFITKKDAQALGWPGGDLTPYAPGKCIGGDFFGNYEGLLPKKEGRVWRECDIDTLGKKSRGAKRIVYSSDGLIYYTGDHYETFEQLYGEADG